MGFFNFLYKLSNIFTNKKRLKFFIVVGLICLFIFACSSGVFASTPQDDTQLMLYQLNLQNNVISYLYSMESNPTEGFDRNAFNMVVKAFAELQVYVTIPEGVANTDFWLYFYVPNSNGNSASMFTQPGVYSVGLNSGTQIDCMLGHVTASRFAQIKPQFQDRVTPIYSGSQTSYYMPSAMYMVRSNSINDFVASHGYMSSYNATMSTSDVELQAIASAGFSSVNSNIQQQTNTMINSINSASSSISNSVNSASSSITNSINSVENTLTDTSTDDNQVQFAQDSTQDITSGFFTGLLNSFQNAFTDNSFKFVSVPIPFTGKSIAINNTYIIDNVKNNSKFTMLVNLATMFWWFVLGYYVLLDIYRKINSLKSGDLTNIENENITTDLL